MAIAHQPAMTTEPVSTRPASTRTDSTGSGLAPSPHELVPIEEPLRAWTLFKIAGLVAVTALSAAIVSAVVIGGALFAIMSFG